ncbi:hypothetical protein KEM55_007233, partial [Ascosphaera atra]
MAPTEQELSLLINPIVADCIQHNTKTLSNIQSIASFLLGLAAGILNFQSVAGFCFYLAGALFVSAAFHLLLISPQRPGIYFAGSNEDEERKSAWRDVWVDGLGVGQT